MPADSRLFASNTIRGRRDGAAKPTKTDPGGAHDHFRRPPARPCSIARRRAAARHAPSVSSDPFGPARMREPPPPRIPSQAPQPSRDRSVRPARGSGSLGSSSLPSPRRARRSCSSLENGRGPVREPSRRASRKAELIGPAARRAGSPVQLVRRHVAPGVPPPSIPFFARNNERPPKLVDVSARREPPHPERGSARSARSPSSRRSRRQPSALPRPFPKRATLSSLE